MLLDPKFPNRPQHPDFWKLSEIILQLDGKVKEQGFAEVLDALDEIINFDSLDYMADQRACRFNDTTPLFLQPFMLRILYMEAFLVGYRFRDRKS